MSEENQGGHGQKQGLGGQRTGGQVVCRAAVSWEWWKQNDELKEGWVVSLSLGPITKIAACEIGMLV